MKKVIVALSLLLVAGCSATAPAVKPPAPTSSDVVETPTYTYTAPTSTYHVPPTTTYTTESPARLVAPTTVDPTTTTVPTVPYGATAKCNDGTYSYSKHRSGTCSSHHGVAVWL